MSSARRLDQALVELDLVETRSQAANLVRLGKVTVAGQVAKKPAQIVGPRTTVKVTDDLYVSRAAYKLNSVAKDLGLQFAGTIVLDVGSSTGGFTDYALQRGAEKVVAIDVGTNQLHPKLRANKHVELHEKTDIRDYHPTQNIDIVLIDVSFISLRKILPHISNQIAGKQTQIVAMLKPQFEAAEKQKNRGVVKNSALRREIIRSFESWVIKLFKVVSKQDSKITGAKGNQERFYLLKLLSK